MGFINAKKLNASSFMSKTTIKIVIFFYFIGSIAWAAHCELRIQNETTDPVSYYLHSIKKHKIGAQDPQKQVNRWFIYKKCFSKTPIFVLRSRHGKTITYRAYDKATNRNTILILEFPKDFKQV